MGRVVDELPFALDPGLHVAQQGIQGGGEVADFDGGIAQRNLLEVAGIDVAYIFHQLAQGAQGVDHCKRDG